ncbi:MAG: DNA/RNA nuclease SfsA [Betaproteobacteria bacterium]|nr:DNA/RNA nuclease SfsA [Betaproteobacteria bacterium]
MRFEKPLVRGRLLARYRRFLADVLLDSGETVTAHCPNTGSMLGVAGSGSEVWLAHDPSPARKCAYRWELTELRDGTLVGINTHRANTLVCEAIRAGRIPALAGHAQTRAEVPYGEERSRIDLLLQGPGRPDCYVEVKNVTAAVENGIALFPDAVSTRGTKHLRELVARVARGDRAALVFCVQRADVVEVRPADTIDPVYGRTLRDALAAGVEVYAMGADVSRAGIDLVAGLRVVCPEGAAHASLHDSSASGNRP